MTDAAVNGDEAPSVTGASLLAPDGELGDQLEASLRNRSATTTEAPLSLTPPQDAAASPFDFVLSGDGTAFGAVSHSADSPAATIIAAAERALDRDIGLLVIGDSIGCTEQAAAALLEPYRTRRPEGLLLHDADEPLTLPDGSTPVVAADGPGEWVLSTDGELRYRVDDAWVIRGHVEAPVTSFDIDVALLEPPAGTTASDGADREHDAGDRRVSRLGDRYPVPAPVVPSQPEFYSALPAIELTYWDDGTVHAATHRLSWRLVGIDDVPPGIVATEVASYTDRYLCYGDGVAVDTVLDRFGDWYAVRTDRPRPPRQLVASRLPRIKRRVTDDGIERLVADRQWIIPPGTNAPACPLGAAPTDKDEEG